MIASDITERQMVDAAAYRYVARQIGLLSLERIKRPVNGEVVDQGAAIAALELERDIGLRVGARQHHIEAIADLDYIASPGTGQIEFDLGAVAIGKTKVHMAVMLRDVAKGPREIEQFRHRNDVVRLVRFENLIVGIDQPDQVIAARRCDVAQVELDTGFLRRLGTQYRTNRGASHHDIVLTEERIDGCTKFDANRGSGRAVTVVREVENDRRLVARNDGCGKVLNAGRPNQVGT